MNLLNTPVLSDDKTSLPHKGWLRWCLLVCLSLLLFTGCSVNPSAGKTLRVANEPAFPPFEFLGTDGKSQGFSALHKCGMN